MSNVEPVVSVRGLHKSIDGRPVLEGIDLDVYPGEVLVILGGSGSGKSTLLRHIIGSVRPDEGSVHMFGKNICSMAEEELTEMRKRMGVLFQSGALFSSMTVRENVALPLQEHTDLRPDVINAIVTIKLELVGLREHAEKYPGQLSGGMRKRAGFARAVAMDPSLLLCDEPSAGLDPIRTAELDRLIVFGVKQLGVACIVVTHEMQSAFNIADRMAMIGRGRILALDSKEAFVQLRDMPDDEAAGLDEKKQVLRRFLRGDGDGQDADREGLAAFARDLFGAELAST